MSSSPFTVDDARLVALGDRVRHLAEQVFAEPTVTDIASDGEASEFWDEPSVYVTVTSRVAAEDLARLERDFYVRLEDLLADELSEVDVILRFA